MNELNNSGNKFKLWNNFNDKGYFNHVMSSSEEQNKVIVANVQKIFENCIEKVKTNAKPSDNLFYLNNEVEKIFVRELRTFRETNENKKHEAYNLNNFDSAIEKKQKEFDELMKVPKPKEINFKTVNDEPFTENMDELINEALEKRKLELNDIVKQYENIPKAEEDTNLVIPKEASQSKQNNDISSLHNNTNSHQETELSNYQHNETNYIKELRNQNEELHKKIGNIEIYVKQLSIATQSLLESQLELFTTIEETNTKLDQVCSFVSALKQKRENSNKKIKNNNINKD